MEIIDSHVHIWDPVKGYPWLTGPLRRRYGLADLCAALPENTRVSVILVEADRGDPAETEDLLATAATTPGVAGVVGSALVGAPDAGRRLHELTRGPHGAYLVGIRERLEDRLLLAMRSVASVFLDHQLALELSCARQELGQVADLAALLGPQVAMVIDHLGGPPVDPRQLTRWQRRLDELAEIPSVYLKLSGVLTQLTGPPAWREDVIRRAVSTLGPSRTMIGSDWPVCLSRGSWSTAMSVVLDAIADSGPDAIELVGGQTARTAFRLQTSCLSPSTMGTSS